MHTPLLNPLASLLLVALGSFTLPAQAAETYQFKRLVQTLIVTASPETPATNEQTPPPAPLTYTAAVSAAQLVFDPQALGGAQTKSVLFLNTGTGMLTLSQPTVSGAAFASTTRCGSTLAPGADCQTDVTFSAKEMGEAAGSLVFASNAQASPLTVPLSGTGLLAQGALTANTSTDFGSVMVGANVTRVFTFANAGNTAVSNVQASVTGNGLSITANTCGNAATPGSLPANSSCSLTVQYAPTSGTALVGAKLTVTSSAVNSPESMTLSGSGLQALASLQTNTSTDFGIVTVGNTGTLSFTLTNTGNTAATGVYGQVSTAGLSVDSGCGTSASPITLAVNASCTMTVTYQPTLEGSLSSAALRVYGSFPTSPLSRGLTGASVAPSDPYWNKVVFRSTFDTSTTAEVGSAVASSNSVSIGVSPARFAGALQLTSTSSKLTYASSASYSFAGDMTIEGWARMTTIPSNGYLFDFGSNGLTLQVVASGSNQYFRISAGGGVLWTSTTAAYISAGTWYHWAVARQGTTMRVYINGTHIGSASRSGTVGGGTLTLGNYGSGGGYSWLGAMDDVRVTGGLARYVDSAVTVPSAALPLK